MQTRQQFSKTISKQVQLEYLLHVPQREGKHPMIIFLHGRGESGNDLDLIKVHGIPRIVEDQPDFPFITVAPQCPIGTSWVLLSDALEALLEEVLARPDVDLARVYLTGISLGGHGTWYLGALRPDVFAAIAPVCGSPFRANVFPARYEALKYTPVWAFHGTDDDVVPMSDQQVTIDALKEISHAEVRFTLYPGVQHDSWTQTYANPELYAWFLKHAK